MSQDPNRQRLDRLRAILAEVDDLQRAGAVLAWDQQTYMPSGGHPARSDQLATLQGLSHERFTASEVGDLLGELRPWAETLPFDSFEASLVRVTARQYQQMTKLPADFVAEVARAGSDGYAAWMAARAERRFAPFAAAFAHLVDLTQRGADYLGWSTCRYDALQELTEPGMTSAKLDRFFGRLKEVLVPLTQAVAAHPERAPEDIIRQPFDEGRQWDLTLEAVGALGFDLRERGRQDKSVHPFTTSFGPGDVRITTRLAPDHMTRGLFSSMHEAGHGLYEQGVPADLWRTPLGGGGSAGLHESQSRLWENVVGRSRGFWEYFLPKARAIFPDQLARADVDALYRAVNHSAPSLIRVDADEVTYNLHIILRYELEQALLSGDLPPADVPGAWNEKVRTYLGLTPPDDLSGVLQDIHWTGGPAAGFTGYALGNAISLQLYGQAVTDRPEIPDGIPRGEFAPLLDWMRQHVHVHGAKLTPSELLIKETGRDLDPEPYLRYIQRKYTEIYGL